MAFFLLVWTLISTKLWGFACFLFRNMFASLVVYFTYIAPNVHFSCLAHCYLLHLPLLLLSRLAQYPVSTSLACHVYFMHYCIMFLRCFVFCLSFISYSSCIPYAFISLFISSFFSPHSSWRLCLFVSKMGRAYQRVYQRIYWTLMHILRGRNFLGSVYIKGRRHLFMRKPCFVLFCFTLCLFSRVFFFLNGALSYFQFLCFVVFNASYLYVGHAYILYALCFIDCMFGRSLALLSDHCSNFHMTAMCLIKLLICFTSCLLYLNLLVTLFLSFITCLFFFPSSSHVLDLGVSEFCHCSQTHV